MLANAEDSRSTLHSAFGVGETTTDCCDAIPLVESHDYLLTLSLCYAAF